MGQIRVSGVRSRFRSLRRCGGSAGSAGCGLRVAGGGWRAAGCGCHGCVVCSHALAVVVVVTGNWLLTTGHCCCHSEPPAGAAKAISRTGGEESCLCRRPIVARMPLLSWLSGIRRRVIGPKKRFAQGGTRILTGQGPASISGSVPTDGKGTWRLRRPIRTLHRSRRPCNAKGTSGEGNGALRAELGGGGCGGGGAGGRGGMQSRPARSTSPHPATTPMTA